MNANGPKKTLPDCKANHDLLNILQKRFLCREDDPDVEDCAGTPLEIPQICPYDAVCVKCLHFVDICVSEGLLAGKYRKRTTSGLLDCKEKVCDRHESRTGSMVSENEAEVFDMDRDELKNILREILNEEMAISDLPMAKKWEGGDILQATRTCRKKWFL